jgi:opacity protein-like surface antigen
MPRIAVFRPRGPRQTGWRLIAAGAAFACLAAPAAAADLPPQPAPPAFSWTGLYGGFNNGYTWRNSAAFTTSAVNLFETSALPGLGLPDRLWGAASALGASGAVGTRLNGFFDGGQLGYNWQFSDRFVAGFEADIQGAGVRGGGGFQTLIPAAVYPPFDAATSVSVKRSLEYFGTVRGRLGYAVTPTMLLYATGGLAYGGVGTSATVRQMLTPSLLLSDSVKSDFFDNRIGWTLGGGVESALTGELSAKLEFLYYDLGSVTAGAQLVHEAAVGPGAVGDAISSATRFNGFAVRAGVNYRFAGSAPEAGGAAAPLLAPQFAAAAPPAFGDWRLTATPYLWALGLNGSTAAHGQTIGTDLSFVDLLTKVSTPPLEFGARFEARNGPFAAYADFFWAQLRASGSALAERTPLTGVFLTADATGHLKFTVKSILEAGAAYELARWATGGGSSTSIDALAGLRYWNISATVGLDITGTVNIPLLGLTQVGNRAIAPSGDLNWVDPLVGLRVRQTLASGDEFQLKGDIGGFGAGSKISWQAFGGYTHNFQFAGLNCQGMIGYRALEVDYAQAEGTPRQSGLNVVMHGPIVGVGVRF